MLRKLFIIIFIILLSTALVSCNLFIAAPTAEIVILHTNDTHGRVVGNDDTIIGIDRIAAVYKNTPNSILVDAGDALHGLPIATLGKGADIAGLMRETGYTAMTIGNHEFNYGWERLVELRDIAGFPFLASNVTKDGSPLLDDTMITEVSGVKIGLFGLITESTAGSAMPDFTKGIVFSDAVQTAREKTEYLRGQGVHVVVALCHLGIEPVKGTLSTQLASEVPDIDVIIDGHSHSELPEGIVENGVLIAQTGQYEGNIGKVTISVEKGVIISKTATLITYDEALDTAPDEIVAEKLSEITINIESILSQPIGESRSDMSSQRSPGVRTQGMPLGSLVADAYRTAADTDIAIANGGDIRADINTGVITKGDVISVLPFGNTLMVKTVTPALLYEVLENGVSGIVTDLELNIDYEQSSQGRFPQVSGFSFIYDPTAPVGTRIISITLDDGTDLSPDDTTTTLTLAGSNYVLSGGDYYTMLSDLPVLHELGSADEALAEYIRKNSPISAQTADRITMLADSFLDAAA